MAKAKSQPKSPASSDDALNVLLDVMNKEDSAMLMTDGPRVINCPVVPTGIVEFDTALGIGGIPVGRIIEIFGYESGGKTTLTLAILAAFQATKHHSKDRNYRACFIDAEHALDPNWAKLQGVKLGELVFTQPSSGEKALIMAEKCVLSGAVELVIIDSVASLTPQKELDGEMGDSNIGLQARMMSQACRKLVSICNQKKVTVIFINQIREKIGVMFGNPETTSGGKALKFYSSIRVELKKKGNVKVGDVVIAAKIKATVIKNKMAPPFRTCEFDINHTIPNNGTHIIGINKIEPIINRAVANKIVSKKGSFYEFEGVNIGNGMAQVTKYLFDNSDVLDKIKSQIYAQIQAGLSIITNDSAEGESGDTADEDTTDNGFEE